MTKKRTVLIAGVGSIGERHLRCFAATGRVDLSICEPNPAVREAAADRHQVRRAFNNFDQALADRPEIVVICTPAHLHIPMAMAAARTKAHLLIEKPLSVDLEGVETLQQIVTEHRLEAAVAYVLRAHPALADMRDAIRAGRFGEPVQIVASSGQHFPFYRPAYRETYYKDRATGGGAIQDALTHNINACEWLAGPITSLAADFEHQVLEGVEVEDTVHILARHNKVMSSFNLNQHQAPNESTLTVNCKRGTARFEYHAARWRWQTEPNGMWHDEAGPALERDSLFIRQAESFLDAVEGRKPPLCTIGEAAQSLRATLAIFAAGASRSWVAVA